MKITRMVLFIVLCCSLVVVVASCETIGGTTTTVEESTTTTLAPTTTVESTVSTDPPTTTTLAPAAEEPEVNEKVIKGTWSWDIETDADGSSATSDIFWEQVSAAERYLTPRNSAEFAVMSGVTFESLDLSDLEAATYSTDRLSASDVGAVVDVGSVIAVHTTEGNYAKLLVTGFQPLESPPRPKYYIVLDYVLYD